MDEHHLKNQTILWLLMFLLMACTSTPSQQMRNTQAQGLTVQHGWSKVALETDYFTLQTFMPNAISKTDVLTIYIEGDGLAWRSAYSPSTNPTPSNPLALKLALLDTGPVVYLARPCQYIEENQSKNCIPKYWTSHRFSAEVIASTNQAIDQIKGKFGAQKLTLVGYSGGGAIAVLAAAKRSDVIKLVTVAGNLNHALWTKQLNLSPLTGSLNPTNPPNSKDVWMDLQKIPQQHYVGGQDAIINESIVRSYARQFKISDNLNISVLPSFDHHCCWETIWPSLVDSHFGNPKAIKP